MSAADLKPPVLLLAMPQVVDPMFHKSVVLLLAHEDEGSFGFIVNRQTEVMVADVLKGLEIPWHGEASKRTFLGGPVQPQLGTVLFGGEASGTQVVPGISITQQLSDLTVLAGDPPPAFKLCLGYAGWGAGQLVSEILRNDWLTAPASPTLVFADAPERAWDAALHSVGIDPSTLPAWTSAADEETAN
ncbi:MAG: YqgE/AlgH family protein [Acidobacteriota bacterium]